MPVKYYVRVNRLTVPPSHACITTAEETLGNDEVAELIHILEKPEKNRKYRTAPSGPDGAVVPTCCGVCEVLAY